MMRGLTILLAATTTFEYTQGNTCSESAPFDCPEGTYCTEWNDGCNDCACNENDSIAAMCTLKMCPCLEKNSCVPTCKDNTACVPKTSPTDAEDQSAADAADMDGDVATATTTTTTTTATTTSTVDGDNENQPVGVTNLFVCPEGTICGRWSDGCNTCGVSSPDQPLAACTEMYCPCYDDNSCVPECLDNSECVPVGEEQLDSGAAGLKAGLLGVTLTALAGYAL